MQRCACTTSRVKCVNLGRFALFEAYHLECGPSLQGERADLALPRFRQLCGGLAAWIVEDLNQSEAIYGRQALFSIHQRPNPSEITGHVHDLINRAVIGADHHVVTGPLRAIAAGPQQGLRRE